MEQFEHYFDLGRLISRHIQGNLSDLEKIELDGWLNAKPGNIDLFKKLTDEAKLKQNQIDFNQLDKAESWKRIAQQSGYEVSRPSNRHIWTRFAAAAIIILISSMGYLFLHKRNESQRYSKSNISKIVPGSNKATLTLANGQQILLSGTTAGVIAFQGKTQIAQKSNGILQYHREVNDTGKNIYNTISTPRGGQYEIILPDNSHAWLNAASSIKFPVSFKGVTREVDVTGEVYFEVAHNKACPFIVHSTGQDIKVLGTHFNVNAYTDEFAVRTTLLEGSVQVSAGKQKRILKPGEQSAVVSADMTVTKVEVADAIAWKNGYFVFANETLPSVMNKLERWYDFKLEYNDESLKKLKFEGSITKFTSISNVLHTLELTRLVRFKIEGNKITAVPYNTTFPIK